jgi:hypothetical protein
MMAVASIIKNETELQQEVKRQLALMDMWKWTRLHF